MFGLAVINFVRVLFLRKLDILNKDAWILETDLFLNSKCIFYVKNGYCQFLFIIIIMINNNIISVIIRH